MPQSWRSGRVLVYRIDCFKSGEEVLAHAILRIPLLTRFSTSIKVLSPPIHSLTLESEPHGRKIAFPDKWPLTQLLPTGQCAH